MVGADELTDERTAAGAWGASGSCQMSRLSLKNQEDILNQSIKKLISQSRCMWCKQFAIFHRLFNQIPKSAIEPKASH